jgi:hypothetical protein
LVHLRRLDRRSAEATAKLVCDLDAPIPNLSKSPVDGTPRSTINRNSFERTGKIKSAALVEAIICNSYGTGHTNQAWRLTKG